MVATGTAQISRRLDPVVGVHVLTLHPLKGSPDFVGNTEHGKVEKRLCLSSEVIPLWFLSNVLQSFLLVTLLLYTADRYGQCAKKGSAAVTVISQV